MVETTGGLTSEELQLRQLFATTSLSTILPKELGQNIQGLA
jgi:hypothetical protein